VSGPGGPANGRPIIDLGVNSTLAGLVSAGNGFNGINAVVERHYQGGGGCG
jgi:hypothetical protein